MFQTWKGEAICKQNIRVQEDYSLRKAKYFLNVVKPRIIYRAVFEKLIQNVKLNQVTQLYIWKIKRKAYTKLARFVEYRAVEN